MLSDLIKKVALALFLFCAAVLAQKPGDLRVCSTKAPAPLIAKLQQTNSKGPRNISGEELAALRGYLWQPGSTLKVAFVDGDPKVQAKIAQVAMEWTKYANIHFAFDGADPQLADIRISFDPNTGSWSYIGRAALSHRGVPTMNYGWLKAGTKQEEYNRVVLHEFGHALGMIHEHQSPNVDIQWNTQAVYNYYWKTNHWTQKDVDQQIFYRYPADSMDATDADRTSIMMYAFEKSLTQNGFETGWNRQLSETDQKKISQLYPKN